MKSFFITLLLVMSCRAMADGDLRFHGFLVTPPVCVISNNETIEVAFSGMQIDDIDGNKYSQKIPYTVDCDSTVRDEYMTMTLTLIGTPSPLSDSAIQTDVDGFAIDIRNGNKAFVINSTLTVNPQALPELTAVPIKQSGVTLAEGNFEAWATLQVDYQ